MSGSPEDLQRYAPYIAGWKRKWAAVAEARLRRAAEARAAAGRCAKLLAGKYGARRVWLFGSALTPERFDERSDLDLAVEGVEDIFGAACDCSDEAPGFEIDLVPFEDIVNPTLRERILQRSELLHGPPT